MFQPTSPVTGAAVTGLTSPTYTIAADIAPSSYGKQYAVTVLGGTQTGVLSHSADLPFTATFSRPAKMAVLSFNTNGSVKAVPKNSFVLLTRKGMNVTATKTDVGDCRLTVNIPAGAVATDPNSVRAMLSAHKGVLDAQWQGIVDTVLSGII